MSVEQVPVLTGPVSRQLRIFPKFSRTGTIFLSSSCDMMSRLSVGCNPVVISTSTFLKKDDNTVPSWTWPDNLLTASAVLRSPAIANLFSSSWTSLAFGWSPLNFAVKDNLGETGLSEVILVRLIRSGTVSAKI